MRTLPLVAAAALAASCTLPSPFVHSSGHGLRKGLSSFVPRGAAIMDDSTLWDPARSSPADIDECSWAFAASGGMNVARLAVKADYFMGDDGKEKPEGFEWLARQLSAAERAGLLVLLDMHIPPGGAIEDYRPTDDNARFWDSPELMGRFVDAWRTIASRYRHDRRIMGYELMNEPTGDPDAYWKLMEGAAQAIRGVDRNHLIVVQPASDGLLRRFKDGNFAYSIHFYAPLSFTHQNVKGEKRFASAARILYPGVAFDYTPQPAFYSRETLARIMRRSASLPGHVKAPVLLGEFGISTAADEGSAERWLKDVMDIASELGLAGTIGWRQTYPTDGDLSLSANGTMAVINADGSYYSPASFFGMRPGFSEEEPDFDARSFYLKCRSESRKGHGQ